MDKRTRNLSFALRVSQEERDLINKVFNHFKGMTNIEILLYMVRTFDGLIEKGRL